MTPHPSPASLELMEDNVLKKLLIRFDGLAFSFFLMKGLVCFSILWFGWGSFNYFFGQA